MTTVHDPAVPTSATAGLERGTRTRRIASGASTIGAGMLVIAGFVTSPWENGSDETSYLHSLTDNPVQVPHPLVRPAVMR